jgi:hypothetical protein
MKMEYDVIAGSNLKDVVKKVNARLSNGWFPVDGIQSSYDDQEEIEYLQTVVKVEQ